MSSSLRHCHDITLTKAIYFLDFGHSVWPVCCKLHYAFNCVTSCHTEPVKSLLQLSSIIICIWKSTCSSKMTCYLIKPENYERQQLWSDWLKSQKLVIITRYVFHQWADQIVNRCWCRQIMHRIFQFKHKYKPNDSMFNQLYRMKVINCLL